MSGHNHQASGSRAIMIAICITTAFMVVQLVGGWIAHSLALMADAAHMFVDVGSLSLSLFAFWVAKRPATPRMSFGFYRAEILGALASAAALWLVCGFLIYEAIRRLADTPDVKGGIVFIIACITLVMNLVTMRVLYRSSKESLNVKSAFIHVLSDLLGNVGVLLAGGIIWLTGWNIVDPILTLLFTCLILFSSYRMVREAVEILMEASPRHIDPDEVREALLNLPQVTGIHDLHIWTVTSGKIALSAHLISNDSDRALKAAHSLLKKEYKILHSTLQVEDSEHFASQYCYELDDA